MKRLSDALQAAIHEGKRMGKAALYFGCYEEKGHWLHDANGYLVRDGRFPDLPWPDYLMDARLLKNGGVPDFPDGRVFWTAGGAKSFWYAFYWWDRSVDGRGACNSGFYVRGFGWPESEAAFEYACSVFPHVVERQKFPLVLQAHPPAVSNKKAPRDERGAQNTTGAQETVAARASKLLSGDRS